MCTSTTFSSYDTGRFYKALTAYWVATESRKLAEQCRFRLQSTENTTYDKVRAIWSQRSGLQESLDVLEVFDFIYGFLCRHIDGMNVDSFSDWVEESWWDELSQRDRWESFMKNAWLALSPADAIELLAFTSLWNQQTSGPSETWSREKRRGFFTANFPGRVMVRDVGETPDAWYSAPDLESACELQLQKLFPDYPSETSAAWETYRVKLWQTNTRSQFAQLSSKRLIEFVAPGSER
ncbi:hypothetical protein B0J11DRAFT_582105 [Dendryphion nanum]|uniref:Uncharacterized protein n=1 Tax=Dendryphion nanum TaxID=256645 RepID=A0A9P9IHJ9_9PLEO|nr:hypothetical protein B0J11DRAFT_582105 [Dendryphion nanum]